MSFESRLHDNRSICQPQSPGLAGRILVVEEDLAIQKVLKRLLRTEGFAVEIHFDGRAGLDSFRANPPSATILDLRLPTLSGRHLCQEMKTAAPSIPVIILSASCEVSDKVLLLEIGADDYVTEPFSPRELMARLRVALRRDRPTRARPVVFDGIVVDFEKVQVTRNGTSVVLTAREFKTLQLLVQNLDRVVTRAELLKQVYGYEGGCTTRTIDNHIMRIRHKLENDPSCPIHFRTVHNVGYRFVL
jgi:DNA-binding response OmpR family regulator